MKTNHDISKKLETLNAMRASLNARLDVLQAGTSTSEAGQQAEKQRAAEQLAKLREYEAALDELLNGGVLLSDATNRLRKDSRFEKFLRAEPSQSLSR